MSTIVSCRAAAMRESASIAAKARVTELLSRGEQIVDFTLGEPDFDTPAHIVEAAGKAMRAGETRYTASNGTPALRQAVAEKLRRENGLEYEPSQIVVGCGAKQIIDMAFAATINAGDEVIIPAPYWVSYPDLAGFHGARTVVVAGEESTGHKLTPDALAAAISTRTKWLVLNSPNNPSGAVYSAAELGALGAVLERHPQVWVLSDEIYEHFVFGSDRPISVAALGPGISARTLTVNGVSKTYAMTGWRIGYGAAPPALAAVMTKLLSQATTCAPSVSQAAAVAALNGEQSFVRDAAQTYAERGAFMARKLQSIPGFRCPDPQGAFYLFPSVRELMGRRTLDGDILSTDEEVETFLLDEAGVAVVRGSAYGLPGHLRLSFATTPDKIANGCDRIASAVAGLR